MPLQTPVVKTGKQGVTDYNNFVRPEDEMWVRKISQKLTRAAYVTHIQFREDVHQILKNAQKYNDAGSLCGHEGWFPFHQAGLPQQNYYHL